MLSAQNPDCGELSFGPITLETNGDYSVEVFLRKTDGSNIDPFEQLEVSAIITAENGADILAGETTNSTST